MDVDKGFNASRESLGERRLRNTNSYWQDLRGWQRIYMGISGH